ncbi:MAG TPA: lysophospholipid acyltransferase family protein [Pyrinomonadaceae bacterium]|nr:lysophospholipid acyltransferase family protein [Pyrinomonadaceae bacterium]
MWNGPDIPLALLPMQASFKQLTLPDLVLNRPGTITFRFILAIFGVALRFFFRRIETVNADVVPKGTGVIFVLNHPNGLVDPALVFVALPRKISFLAKSTLFRMPVISFLLKTVEALPLYRKIDAGEDLSKNQKTFELCSELLRRGGSIALFPEGISHNSPKLLPMKTGAARIALGAAASGAAPVEVKIVPVGLYYTSKTTFRSEALLHFGEPFTVPHVAPDADGEPTRPAVRELTSRIEEELREVTLNAESDTELHNAKIAEQIFASATVNDSLGEKVDFLKNYVGEGGANVSKPDAALATRLRDYDAELNLFGIEPQHLSLAELTQSFVVYRALVQTWVLILLSPFALFGAILHAPAYQLCKLVAYLYSRHGADDIASTVKVLAGMVFVPFTWLVAAGVLYFLSGWQLALASVPFSFLCGYAALYSLEEIEEMRGWAKAIWLFLTRKEKFLRLFVERRELQETLKEFDS